jgi:photosystem II stability/assembly factor-like uncharacterized protein
VTKSTRRRACDLLAWESRVIRWLVRIHLFEEAAIPLLVSTTSAHRLPVRRRGAIRFISSLAIVVLARAGGWGHAHEAEPVRVSSHRAAEEFRASELRNENGVIPDNALVKALQQKQQMPSDPAAWSAAVLKPSGGVGPRVAGLAQANWTWLGPGNIGGRLRSIVIHPTTPSTMYVGSVCGGVWKTINAGTNWFPCNDFMANLAIGCLVLDSANSDLIYAGTGEGFGNSDSLRGAGIFKTTNGGTNWTQLPTTASSSFYYVNRLAISPADPLVLLAATGSGIWRSTDGGTNWSQSFSTSGMLYLAFNPADGSKCVASGTAIALYSTDGGLSWTAATGLAAAGRVELAYAPSSPGTVYASQYNNSGEVYVSYDDGVSYTLVNTGNSYLGSQGWYDNTIWVDPTDPNTLVVGGIDLWRSSNGGATLTKISQWFSAPTSAHADQHCILHHPSYDGSANRAVFFGNDGGIYRADDVYAVSLTTGWTALNHNLGVTEFYGAAGNATSGTIVGGTQDNGTLRYTPTSATQGWTAMFGGDGGFCAADPTDTNYFYGEYVYLQIHRSVNGGASSSYITAGLGDAGIINGLDPDDPDAQSSANFIAPFILDPTNPNTMLAGGSNLWRSVNVKAATPTWSNIKPGANGSYISAIAVAPGNSDVIWVGHNNGDVYSTTNGTAANPTWTRKDLGSPSLPNRKCLRLTVDPINSSRVYACFGGFNSDNVWRTTDGGTTWVNITANLPSAPARSLVIAPFNTNFLYLASEVGVFGSADGGATWSPANEGPANVAVDELFWNGNYLVAATHGRGLFKILLSPNPVISASAIALVAENCPPANGVVDPGEQVTFKFTLVNSSAFPTTNLIGTLLATGGVTIPSAPQNFGALALGGSAVTRSFSYSALGTCGGTNLLTLQLTDGTNNLGVINYTVQLGQPNRDLAENFDGAAAPALPTGWTTEVTGAGAAWVTSTATSDSAPNSAYGGEPVLPGIGDLISPPVAISSASAQLSFRHYYNLEADPVDPTKAYDGCVLEIKIGAADFADILTAGGAFVTGGYTRTIDPTDDNALGSRPAWSGAVGGFITTIVNLPAAAAGQTVQLKWRLGTDTANGYGGTGWYIDNVAITEGYTCCAGPPVIQSVNWTNSVVSVSWSATSGLAYRLQVNTNLATTNWLDVPGDVVAGGTLVSKTNVPAPTAGAFYRIRVLP